MKFNSKELTTGILDLISWSDLYFYVKIVFKAIFEDYIYHFSLKYLTHECHFVSALKEQM